MNAGIMMLAMSDMADKINELYKEMAMPIIAIISGAALLLGIWMGVGFLLSDGDEQKLKKAKSRVKYYIIGFVVIFAVAALTPMFVAMLQTWYQEG